MTMLDHTQTSGLVGQSPIFELTTLLHPSYSPDLAPFKLSSLLSQERLRGKYHAINEEVITAVIKSLKNSLQNFTKLGYMLSFEDGPLQLREILTILRSRDVILRGPAVSIIIPVLK